MIFTPIEKYGRGVSLSYFPSKVVKAKEFCKCCYTAIDYITKPDPIQSFLIPSQWPTDGATGRSHLGWKDRFKKKQPSNINQRRLM